VWLLLLVFTYVLGVDCIFLYNMIKAGTVASWILAPFVVTALFVVMWGIYAFAYIARFQAGLKIIMKNSAFFVIRHLLRSLLLAVVFVASVAIFMFLPITIVILPTLGMFLMTVILESIFEKYMSDEDLAAEAERNQVYYN